MRELPFRLVDAFADKAYEGNPCAVVFDADELSDIRMQAIAREMNQSETAFLMRSRIADLKARYFTPEREIPLAGHPTIASVHAAIESGWIVERRELSLELKEGPIRIEVESANGRRTVRMHQRKPVFLSTHSNEEVLPLFGLDAEDLLPNAPIQTVSTGTPMLMVPLRSQEALRKLAMDPVAYRAYRAKSGFFSPHLFCLKGISPEAATFARHLGTPPDSAEDFFTGSATGCMAAYLWKHGLIRAPRFIAEQGHWLGRPGRAEVEIQGPAGDPVGVIVGGAAVTVLTGTLLV